MEIARDEKPVEMGMNRVGVWGDREMNFIQTQFKIITSYETLGLVADKLNLIQRWGRTKTEVIEELLDSIDPEEVRGTDLIDIAVYRQRARRNDRDAEREAAVSEGAPAPPAAPAHPPADTR